MAKDQGITCREKRRRRRQEKGGGDQFCGGSMHASTRSLDLRGYWFCYSMVVETKPEACEYNSADCKIKVYTGTSSTQLTIRIVPAFWCVINIVDRQTRYSTREFRANLKMRRAFRRTHALYVQGRASCMCNGPNCRINCRINLCDNFQNCSIKLCYKTVL